jgi:hypothetical protein
MADTQTSLLSERVGVSAPHSLNEAIALLEAGQGAGLIVDLGGGRLARADTMRGEEGLLQRLRGHKMILALASGAADLTRYSNESRPLQIAPEVQDIVDVIISRG